MPRGSGYIYKGEEQRVSVRKNLTEEAVFYHCSSTMADIDVILASLRRAAAVKGPEWLQSQIGELIEDEAGGSTPGEVTYRARRLRGPARFSPGPASRPPPQKPGGSIGASGKTPPATACSRPRTVYRLPA